METYIVSFFGHREINNMSEVENAVEQLLLDLLKENETIEIKIGRNGDFDRIVSSTVKRVKKRVGNDRIFMVLVLPYVTKELKEYEKSMLDYYDDIEVFEGNEKVHFKKIYELRNQKMVDQSDMICFFVKRTSGGAYKTMKYAKKMDKPLINIADRFLAL